MLLETAVAEFSTTGVVLTASVNVKNSSTVFVPQRHVLDQIVFEYRRNRVNGDILADFFVFQPKFEVLLQLLESTFRVEFARSQERHQEHVCLGWKCQIFFSCNEKQEIVSITGSLTNVDVALSSDGTGSPSSFK